ncbi:MAG: CoA pyrophosphatase [Deltaproteobacteria bacterium]|nr:CoA pyrophosphatase [Deltaproteobacteria bacterium]
MLEPSKGNSGSGPGLAPESLPSTIWNLESAELPWSGLALSPAPRGPSAVLALFVAGQNPRDQASLVLTRRSTTVRSHKGQISFAGGRCDPIDVSPSATALREAHEELGLAPDLVKVHGMLPPITGLDGAAIYPVVGSANVQPNHLVPAAAEVAEVFTVPWPLVSRKAAKSFDFNLFGHWRSSWMFETPRGTIWGLTALILYRAALA